MITRRGGVKPKQPTNWVFLQLLTGSGRWTVPNDGWYRVYCVGKSGDGGKGGNGRSTYNPGGGGAGGNSGGVAISALYLRKDTSVPITVSTTVSSFGSYLSATAGGNGGAGVDGPAGGQGGAVSGTVGNGMGGSISNVTGLYGGGGGVSGLWGSALPGAGVGGNSGGLAPADSNGNINMTGGGGGSGNNLQGLGGYYQFVNKYGGNGIVYHAVSTGGWGSPALTTPPVLYGSGGGGGGGGWHSSMSSWAEIGAPGGVGTPGCIIIERGA